ncbi:hypothetical protein LBMAG21_04160 [Armatimonadota bacterium]|nr:hypothetical protein LBMAG21_04160 [Armatimonadota bacterium]
MAPLYTKGLVLLAILGITLSGSACLADGNFLVFSHRETKSFEQMLEALSKADVVVVGEEHDHKLGHTLELQILKGLQAHNPSQVFSLEMFERDVQLPLNEYLADQISQSSFLAASRPWPTYATDYAPLIEFCKANRLPVIAANAPRRYVSAVSRKGQSILLDLPKASKAYLAKLPISMDLPPEYDAALNAVFGNHGNTGTSMPSLPPFIKEGQALWDATMADSILRGRKQYRKSPIMQINGSMHSDYGYGLVDRLRKTDKRLKVMIVSIKRDRAYPQVDATQYEKTGDFVIVTGEEPKK